MYPTMPSVVRLVALGDVVGHELAHDAVRKREVANYNRQVGKRVVVPEPLIVFEDLSLNGGVVGNPWNRPPSWQHRGNVHSRWARSGHGCQRRNGRVSAGRFTVTSAAVRCKPCWASRVMGSIPFERRRSVVSVRIEADHYGFRYVSWLVLNSVAVPRSVTVMTSLPCESSDHTSVCSEYGPDSRVGPE